MDREDVLIYCAQLARKRLVRCSSTIEQDVCVYLQQAGMMRLSTALSEVCLFIGVWVASAFSEEETTRLFALTRSINYETTEAPLSAAESRPVCLPFAARGTYDQHDGDRAVVGPYEVGKCQPAAARKSKIIGKLRSLHTPTVSYLYRYSLAHNFS